MIKGEKAAAQESLRVMFLTWLKGVYGAKYPLNWDGPTGLQIEGKLNEIAQRMADVYLLAEGSYREAPGPIKGSLSHTTLESTARKVPEEVWPGAKVLQSPNRFAIQSLKSLANRAKIEWNHKQEGQ